MATAKASPSASITAALPSPSLVAVVVPPPLNSDDIRLQCGSPLEFSADALQAPPGAEHADHPAAEALRQLLNETPFSELHGWKLVAFNETEALFMVPAAPTETIGFWSAEFVRRDGAWAQVRSGQCDLQPAMTPVEPAIWELAPGEEVTRESRDVDILVTELGCSSGQSPEGRIVPAAAIYLDTSIIVIFGTHPLPGPQTCQPAPPVAVVLHLDEPIGARALLDGHVFPPELRVSAP